MTPILAVAIGAGATASIAALIVLLRFWRTDRGKFRSGDNFNATDLSITDLDDFDPASIDFIELMTWNKSNPLHSSSIRETIEVSDKPEQTWVDGAELEAVVARTRLIRSYGPACSLVSFEADALPTSTLRFNVTRDSYADYVAIREYLQDEQRMSQVRSYAREHSIETVIAQSPLSVIAVNVTVVTDGSLLLMRRSNAVSTFRGYWQFGPHKSLGFKSDGNPENASDLARRALREEAGLEPHDYGDRIVFSWFGIYLREATPYVFAHVFTRLSKLQVERRVAGAVAAYETSDGGERVDWMPLTADTIESVTDTWRSNHYWGQSDSQGRRYLPHAVVGLRQLARAMDSLG